MGLTLGATGKLMTLNGKLFTNENGYDCCCNVQVCCCPGPTRIKVTLRQLTGSPCGYVFMDTGLPPDGHVFYLNADPLEPGQECYDRYRLDGDTPGAGVNGVYDIGSVAFEMEFICDDVTNQYALTFLHAPAEQAFYDGVLISGSCDPWGWVFHCKVNAFQVCGLDEVDHLYELTFEDVSP